MCPRAMVKNVRTLTVFLCKMLPVCNKIKLAVI